MSMRRLFVPALAIITLMLLACSASGDTLPGSNATSQDPTATPDLLSQLLAGESDLDLENLDMTSLAGLLEAFPDATGFSECLTSSIGLSGLAELAEREPTDADIETVTSCLSEDQLKAFASASASGLDFSGFDITVMEGLSQELLNSPELAECLTSSMSFDDLMKLAENEPTDADIEQAFPCLSGGQLDSLTSSTAAGSDLGSLGEIDLEGLAELMSSPETTACLTESMSLSSLMQLAAGEPTEADIEPLMACFSQDQLDALSGLTSSP